MKLKEKYYLWGLFAGRCGFKECRKKLYYEMENKEISNIGELSHIVGQSPQGPRGDPDLSMKKKEDPSNIILLCKDHHKIIDDHHEMYNVDKLQEMREEHVKWVIERLDQELKDELWTGLILYDTDFGVIDESTIMNEFLSDLIFQDIFQFVSEGKPRSESEWSLKKEELELWWKELYSKSEINHKFAIFSIQYIPIMIYLGYLIRDAMPVKLFQYQRVKNTWKWFYTSTSSSRLFNNLSEVIMNPDKKEIAISVSLSAAIDKKDIYDVIDDKIDIIEFFINNPSRTWLNSEDQLTNFKEFFIESIDKILSKNRQIERIHLFCACPTPIAFAIGSLINPTMFPVIQTYKFVRKEHPSYKRAISFNKN